MFIYKTTNKINGKIYIGQSSKNEDVEYFGSGKILIIAIKKYGKEFFTREIIERCDDKETTNIREIYWIKELNANDRNIGYNISMGGNGGNLGELVNQKISQNAFRPYGNQHRKGKTAPNKGVPMSEDQKEKMRKPKTKEHIENVRTALLNSKKRIKILCVDTGEIYTMREAVEIFNVHLSNLVNVLKGRQKRTGGYKFVYYKQI